MADLNNPIQPESSAKTSTPEQYWKVFLLGLFLGWAGAHRFYAGKTRSAIIMLVTCGGFGLGQLFDVFTIWAGTFRNQNGMVYENPRPGLSALILLVLYGGAIYVEVHNHPMHYSMPRQLNRVLPPMSRQQVQAELNSFGPPVTSTNAMLQQLFATYAKQHFGRLAVVQFTGPGTNGDYTVTVHMRADGGVQTSLYFVTLDASGTNIVAWR